MTNLAARFVKKFPRVHPDDKIKRWRILTGDKVYFAQFCPLRINQGTHINW